jgi:3-deoxy-D-arabino-heptulosonate 7-phosphate (DAHP) synthase
MELRYISLESNKRKVVKVKDAFIGDGDFAIIAGPCSVENVDMSLEVSDYFKKLVQASCYS